MKLLEKILVPVYFDENYEHQITMAGQLAEQFHSQVILLHVLPQSAKEEGIASVLKKGVHQAFEEVREQLGNKAAEVKTLLRYGTVFDQIIEVAQIEEVNVIITQGSSPEIEAAGKHPSLTAEKLIRKSDKPVWINHPAKPPAFDRLICPVDFSPESKRALDNAIKLARTFSGELHIVHVYEPLEYSLSKRLSLNHDRENEKMRKASKVAFDKFLQNFVLKGINYHQVILDGKADKEIADYAEQIDASLMLMGTTGKTHVRRALVGTVTEKVVRRNPCPIVTMKSEDILNLKISEEIEHIEKHYAQANELIEKGFWHDAAQQLELCLEINDMHLPSMYKLVTVYQQLNNNTRAKYFDDLASEITSRLWDRKIEVEIRKHYRTN